MKSIIWDVDETINSLVKEWLPFWREFHPECKVTYNQIKDYDLSKILKSDMEDIRESFNRFKRMGYFDILKPDEKVLRWFEKYGNNFYHIALTVSSIDTASVSAKWVFNHFGKWIRSFHVLPYQDNLYDKTKMEYIKRVGGVYFFIDDCKENCEQVKKLGVKTFNVKKPWNDGIEMEEILSQLI